MHEITVEDIDSLLREHFICNKTQHMVKLNHREVVVMIVNFRFKQEEKNFLESWVRFVVCVVSIFSFLYPKRTPILLKHLVLTFYLGISCQSYLSPQFQRQV
jgi:hypothetical protein